MKQTHLLTLLLLSVCGLLGSCKEEEENTIPCTDFSGKNYKTVVIGDQVWMAENLSTKKFVDGSDIYNSRDVNSWPNRDVAQYSYYSDNMSYSQYGVMYNYLSVVEPGLIPKGWRLPTREDWQKLIDYIKAHHTYNSSAWVGKALASKEGWQNSTTVGAIGNNPSTNNLVGFNVLAGGYRSEYGAFVDETQKCTFWTGSVDPLTGNLQVVTFSNNAVDVQWETLDKVNGACYIRCVKDR